MSDAAMHERERAELADLRRRAYAADAVVSVADAARLADLEQRARRARGAGTRASGGPEAAAFPAERAAHAAAASQAQPPQGATQDASGRGAGDRRSHLLLGGLVILGVLAGVLGTLAAGWLSVPRPDAVLRPEPSASGGTWIAAVARGTPSPIIFEEHDGLRPVALRREDGSLCLLVSDEEGEYALGWGCAAAAWNAQVVVTDDMFVRRPSFESPSSRALRFVLVGDTVELFLSVTGELPSPR